MADGIFNSEFEGLTSRTHQGFQRQFYGEDSTCTLHIKIIRH